MSAIERETRIHNLLLAFARRQVELRDAALELVRLSPYRFQHSADNAAQFILNNA